MTANSSDGKSSSAGLSRRRLVTGGALGAAALAAGCDCAERCGVDGGPAVVTNRAARELKMVTTLPKDFPGLGEAATNVAKAITEMSGGSLRVKVFAAGELVGAFESFDAVAQGAADMYHGADYYWVGKSKAYAFFTAVPFGMTAQEIMAWTEFGGGQALWDELGAGFGMKHFAAGNTGVQMGGWFKRDIRSLDDMKGLKIRMPGLGGEAMRRIGAAAVSLPGGELFQALQSGTIDATEWVGPWNDLAFGFYTQAKYYLYPGIHEPGAQLTVGMNLDVWEDLTLAERSIIENACRAANHRSIAQYAHYSGEALKVLLEEHGVQLRRQPADVLKALAEATQAVLEEAAAEDDITGRTYESFKRSLATGAGWSAIADEAYLAARRDALGL
ncbi:MAG: TRAP transporter substrate-binding protein [Pseudomonadota bacterium]